MVAPLLEAYTVLSFTPAAENLYLLVPVHEFETRDTREYAREWEMAQSWSKMAIDEKTKAIKYEKSGSFQIVSANQIFTKLRSIKSPYEIRTMTRPGSSGRR